MYAEIMVDIAHTNIDRMFDYRIPNHLINHLQPGSRVRVPFSGRFIEGFVMAIKPTTDFDPTRIKDIETTLDTYPAIPPSLLSLATWMRQRYHCLMIDCLRLMLPADMRGGRIQIKETQVAELLIDHQACEAALATLRKNATSSRLTLELLKETPEMPLSELRAVTGVSNTFLQSAQEKGWLRITSHEIYRAPYKPLLGVSEAIPHPTAPQSAAIQALYNALNARKGGFYLLGVTGSGKTEVYLQAIDHALSLGRGAIALVPEISLTPQMVERFRARFGERVAVLHSRLSAGERYDEWRRIRKGEATVVVGPRSAVFAPLNDLGIIVVDEEHENSYASEHTPRYHAIEVAQWRCEHEGGVLLMGSATPSVEMFARAQAGEFRVLPLPDRINGAPLPPVEVVDMRRELTLGNRSVLSQTLYEALQATISKDEQAILFLNRRGYSTFICCRECGQAVVCKQCDVAMTYHIGDNHLKCHYCSAQEPVPQKCPKCGSVYIRHFGTGTQKVEEEVQKLFPSVKLLRMDVDTTGGKDAHMRMLETFRHRHAQVLIGTQMIAKGLDFPNVTLVGVIAADTTLNLPDYHSPERAFQLITQVAGRAGRHHALGRVVVQTYQPEHYAVQFAAKHDFLGFYACETELRSKTGYPPYTIMVCFLVTGEDPSSVSALARELLAEIQKLTRSQPDWASRIMFLQVSPAPLSKLKGRYRWQVLLKWKRQADEWPRLAALYETMDRMTVGNGMTLHMEEN